MDYTRQKDLVSMLNLGKISATLIGAGAIGSFAALTLTKMGLRRLEVYDEDGVSAVNLPNQFYREKDIKQFKVEALASILKEFNGLQIRPRIRFYSNQKLREVVIVATDSMHSRKLVWEQFKKQPQAKYYIEARMGAELGIVYVIRSKSKANIRFYEQTLYPDSAVKPLPCTAKSIIYNILMISSLICRGFKSIVNKESFPRETVFNIRSIDKYSLLIRK